MTRRTPRLLALVVLLLSAALLPAEKVADLPVPTSYVNDFAHVLTPEGQRKIEDLSLAVHHQAGAELVVVTIKSLDAGQSVEEFTVQLEEKWKLGKKGEDRSALIVLVMKPHKLRVETGYGLEGILNDAKVGGILDRATPFAKAGDYDQALLAVDQGLADVIAADKGVSLTPIVHEYHRQQVPHKLGIGQIVLGIGFVILILILIRTGHIGWAFYLILSVMGGGGGGGRDDEGGGGFGGSGGGGSGGGGASRDF